MKTNNFVTATWAHFNMMSLLKFPHWHNKAYQVSYKIQTEVSIIRKCIAQLLFMISFGVTISSQNPQLALTKDSSTLS